MPQTFAHSDVAPSAKHSTRIVSHALLVRTTKRNAAYSHCCLAMPGYLLATAPSCCKQGAPVRSSPQVDNAAPEPCADRQYLCLPDFCRAGRAHIPNEAAIGSFRIQLGWCRFPDLRCRSSRSRTQMAEDIRRDRLCQRVSFTPILYTERGPCIALPVHSSLGHTTSEAVTALQHIELISRNQRRYRKSSAQSLCSLSAKLEMSSNHRPAAL